MGLRQLRFSHGYSPFFICSTDFKIRSVKINSRFSYGSDENFFQAHFQNQLQSRPQNPLL
jgi:hypothetical protein